MSSLGPLLIATAILATPFVQGAPSAPDYQQPFAAEFEGSRANERDWNFRLGPRTGTEAPKPQFYLPA